MRRLSENLVSMAALVAGCDGVPRADVSGKFLRGERKMAQKDKRCSRLSDIAHAVDNLNMKAVVPCLVLGSSFLSALAVVMLSYFLLD